MATSRTLISVEEYVATRYRPDRDYVDGIVEERNVGKWDHGDLQLAIGSYLRQRQKKWGIRVVVETRVQVSKERFRVPDVCVVLGEPGEQILTQPPFICIEVLSPEDRLSRLEDRVDDYLKMGVPNVWVLDPRTKRAWNITPSDGWREEKSGTLKTENPALEVPLAEIFS
jgi:Uma2 family endonuclease